MNEMQLLLIESTSISSVEYEEHFMSNVFSTDDVQQYDEIVILFVCSGFYGTFVHSLHVVHSLHTTSTFLTHIIILFFYFQNNGTEAVQCSTQAGDGKFSDQFFLNSQKDHMIELTVQSKAGLHYLRSLPYIAPNA